MLKKMWIKNFKCFKNETVFDFRKTNYKVLEQNSYGKILKGALFVGDNASGKTTAIQPIKLLLDLLLKDRDVDLSSYACLFSKEVVTSLQYEFDIDGAEIYYSFSFCGDAFVEERLEAAHKIIIERIKENAKLHFQNETAFHEVDGSILFLKQVYFNTKFSGDKFLVKWFDFLKRSIYIDAYSRKISTYNGKSLSAYKFVEKQGIDSLNEFLDKNNFKYSILYEEAGNKEMTDENDDSGAKSIFFERQDIDTPIPYKMESLGNKTLLNMLPSILSVVRDGGMLIIDEFSSGLHNKLEELLIKYIMKNGKTTQLFFVSHSTNLLSNSILRPDQIYVVEMEGDKGSRLYRFSEEQPRVAQNLEKMYLSGVFGGIPEYGTGKG